MEIEETEKKVIELWSDRPSDRQTTFDILNFYGYLQKEWSSLLEFEYKGDKYQVIRTWIEAYKYNLDNP